MIKFTANARGAQGVWVFQKNDDETLDPDVDPEERTIHLDDVVVWRHRGKKAKDVHIEFEKEAFYGMTPVGSGQNARWAITNCKGGGCVSSWPKTDGRFKYWQILDDPNNPDPNKRHKEKDGWIVIDRGN